MVVTFKDWLKDQNKEMIEETKKKYEFQQWGFGKLFERNFIQIATEKKLNKVEVNELLNLLIHTQARKNGSLNKRAFIGSLFF